MKKLKIKINEVKKMTDWMHWCNKPSKCKSRCRKLKQERANTVYGWWIRRWFSRQTCTWMAVTMWNKSKTPHGYYWEDKTWLKIYFAAAVNDVVKKIERKQSQRICQEWLAGDVTFQRFKLPSNEWWNPRSMLASPLIENWMEALRCLSRALGPKSAQRMRLYY